MEALDVETILRRSRGLDLTNVERTTADELRAFQAYYSKTLGRPHKGLDFWLDERPDVLKRHRLFAEQRSRPGGLQTDWTFHSFFFHAFYAITGYVVGIRYLVYMNQMMGLTKDQILEGLGIAFIHCGPRGMETIAEALTDYEWIEPPRRVTFPLGWDVDPDAFRSGLDFSKPELTEDEARALEGWYERWLGEVPRYVRFMTKNRPEMLKAHRHRYEKLLKILPKQVLPMTLLSYNTVRGFGDGIRENVLLAKGFGVSKEHVWGAMNHTLLYSGVEALDIVDRAVGDVLEKWS